MLLPNLFTHLVVGFFLLLVTLSIARYLWREYGFHRGQIRIPIPIYLMLALGISGIAGLLTLAMSPLDALLALAFGIGVCLSLFHPMAAVSFFVSCLLLRPWEIFASMTALAAFPRLLAATTLISWVASRFLRRRMTFVWNRWLTLFTLFFAWLIISSLISANHAENFDFIFKVFLPIYIVCVLLVNSVETQDDLTLLKKTITLSLTGVIAAAMTITIAHPDFAHGMRLQGVVGLNGNSNDLAAFSVICSPFALLAVMHNWRSKKVISWVDLICLGVLLVGLLMTKSRAGAMAFGASVFVYMLLTTPSIFRLLLRLSLAAPLVLVFLMAAMKRDAADLEGSSDSRFNYIIAGFRMLRDFPLFGVGVNNYPRYYDTYTMSYLETGERTAHSTWMLLLSETGPIGLLLFGILFFATVRAAWRMRKIFPEFLMSIAGYGIKATVLSHSYTLFPYLIIFLILSASRVVLSNKGIDILAQSTENKYERTPNT